MSETGARRRKSWARAAAVALTLAAVGPAHAQDYTSAEAPYQIVASTRSQIRVDIGVDPKRASSLRQATVLTPSGAVGATFVRTRRICERLCDADEPECHYEVVLRLSKPVIEPIAVLAGRPVVSSPIPVNVGVEQPVAREDTWLAATPIEADGGTYRWTRFPDGVFFTFGTSRDFYAPPISLNACRQAPVDTFTLLTCADNSAHLLYEGSRGIIKSFADYGEAVARPMFRFRLGDKDAILIRVGFKAEAVIALLVKEDGQWKLKARGSDYALLC